MRTLPLSVVLACLAGGIATAQAQDSRVYRCGNEYTNDVRLILTRPCTLVEGGNVTIIQNGPPPGARAQQPASASGPAATAGSTSVAAAGPNRIDTGIQRSRDLQARQILAAELDRSMNRMQTLQSEYDSTLGASRAAAGTDPQSGRVAELKADIDRTQSDIEGLRREIGRLPAQP
ncbi:hypothetical protein EC845_3200 [Comamonas sp. BIGb0124]|uniref:hypothetical protein n=1 Tax=Comamonas sp. BIGb0124 TaxID=2485130 RepID=UPI000F47257E|nr:hypothetical protein [Comamonas sp. BIGb0124]ROR20380.1 hypothetical protein EC845_3200 [Comamonas sp. BIGb0124]